MIVRGGKKPVPTETTKRRWLGDDLKGLRERAGLDMADAAELLDKSVAVVSRLENGLTGITNRDLKDLVTFYIEKIGTNPDGSPADGGESVDIADFLDTNRGAKNPSRWTGYRGTHAKWFRRAVEMEADAVEMSIYGIELFHGLLQSEEYMLALFSEASMNQRDRLVAQKLRARRERQEVLTKPDAPEITFVLSQSVLERMVGSPTLQASQLEHVARLAELPSIHIHVYAFDCKTATGTELPFTMFRLPSRNPQSPSLECVYVEQHISADYYDRPQDVENYRGFWSGLLGAALDPVASRDLLLATARRLHDKASAEGDQ
jgi:transcriptional regulator with XRE-family HTH domain